MASSTTAQLFDVSDKVVVVTGGSSGIGEMAAHGLAAAGAHVVISSRKAANCEAVVEAITAAGGRATSLPADLSSEEGCRDLASRVGEVADRLDVLVNNAGATWGAALEDHDEASWDRVLDLNVQGVFHTTKFLLPLLRAAATDEDPARVVNVASVDGMRPPLLPVYSYSTSKAGLIQLTRHLAAHLAPLLTVNALAPGPFPSRMMAATLESFGDEIRERVPMRRIGRPDDVVGALLFLCSRAGAYVTGSTIPLDGGIVGAGGM